MASHVTRYPTLDLPHPFRAAVPFVLLAVACAASEVDPRLPWLVGALGAVSFILAAALRGGRARLELAAVRRTADRLIVQEPRSSESLELVRWRSDELTSLEARDGLRREVLRTLADLDPKMLPSASPLRRPAARASEPLLRALADRLGSSRPVSPRGVLLARSLLRDAGSPLYSDGAELLLPRALRRVLCALDP